MTKTSNDCGCHDTTAPAAEAATTTGAGRTVYVSRDVPASAKPVPKESSSTKSTYALEGFRGLNPQDGLFLRGEHLAAIQAYSRSLTSALATASGPGIVHGLGVAMTGKSLIVSPGLAISPVGRLLLLSSAVKIPLGSDLPPLSADGFWSVELHWASDTSGSEPAYGNLCADPCAGGDATIEPWLDEGVDIQIVAKAETGFAGVAGARRRGNWLSSAYFERERNTDQWLVPGEPETDVRPLRTREWTNGTPAPGDKGVPLAILYRGEPSVGSDYRLQVWTARRLVDGPVAHSTWRSRLAMRSWSVFLAQILQFEAEVLEAVSDSTGPGGALILDLGDAHQYLTTLYRVYEQTGHFIDNLKDRRVRERADVKELINARKVVEASPFAGLKPPSVPEFLGLDELPPAGYLPMDERAADPGGEIQAFFGDGVDLRIRHVRADQVADEVIAAQHRDRIPLHPVGDRRPQVDVLLPTVPADRHSQSTPFYGWAAFVRRGTESVSPAAMETKVAVHILEDNDFELPLTEPDRIEASLGEPIDSLTYPIGEWEYPGSEAARQAVAEIGQRHPIALLACAVEDDAPLAALRAGLLWLSLDSGSDHLPIFAFGGRPRDAIIVIVQDAE